MGIFDIFKKKEQYNGITLNENVDPELQKRLIDLGQQDKISSLDYQTIKKENQPQSVMQRLTSDQPTITPDNGQPKSSVINFVDKAKDFTLGVGNFMVDRYKKSSAAEAEFAKLLGEKKVDEAFAFKKSQSKEAQQDILDATFNTPTGKKVTSFVSETTSDLPIKMAAALDPILPLDSGVKDLPYEQRLQAYRDAFRNSQFSDNAAVRIADIAMNSGIQSAIGVMLNFVPYVGKPLSTGYWASISAQEQVEKRGDVYSMGNIAIDTIGDRILGNMIGGMFKSKQTVTKFASAFKGFFTEGGTEVAQTILKQGNDYLGASSDEEKKKIKQEMIDYIVSGDILIELTGAGISGAGISTMGSIMGSTPSVSDVNIIAEKGKAHAPIPEIYQEAVDQAQMEIGETPNIIKEAVAEAKMTTSPESFQAPESIFHMTNANTESIKDGGFQMGLNSAFGEAAFFAGEANKLYGDNQLEVKASDFNLRTIDTVQEQMDFIAEYKAKNLADAIRKEGEYDGFLIPQPNRANDVYGITNQEKLNQVLKAQQFITTDEALAMRSDFKFLEDLDIPMTAKNNLMTPKGEEAYGKYSAGMISFLANPHKTTIPHETTHAFVDLMLDAKQKQDILNEVKRRYAGQVKQMMAKRNLSEDLAAEEVLADDFAKYYLEKKDKGSSQKSSSKLRQFYDWFVEQLQKLFGTGDKLNRLYKDIETKKPTVADRKRAIKKLTMTLENLEKLQRQYFQEPEKLTTKFLEHSELKNREFVSYMFLKNLLSSKTLPLKDVERALISDVLETQFKDNKKISLEDFKNAVIGELMPLSIIESDTYADYGSENIGLGSGDDTSIDHKTYIFNSGFEHGYTGHFSSDFTTRLSAEELKIVEIPKGEQNASEKWAVVKKDVELTEDNIQENVFTVTETRQGAIDWVNNHSTNGMVTATKNTGLFSHVRTFDIDGALSYVAEIQSDSFQNRERLLTSEKLANDIQSSIRDLNNDIFNAKEAIKDSKQLIEGYQNVIKFLSSKSKLKDEILNDPASLDYSVAGRARSEKITEKFGIPDFILGGFRELYVDGQNLDQVGLMSKAKKMVDEQTKDLPRLEKRLEGITAESKDGIAKLEKELSELKQSPEEAAFMQYKNIWHERTVREIIRQKAVEGFKTLYFPTPRTVSLIEGYASEDGTGQIPINTDIGEEFDYGGTDYVVLAEDEQMGEEAARVAPVSDLRGIFDYDSARQEEVDRVKEEIVDELENTEDFEDTVKSSTILSQYLTNEEVAEMIADYKKNKDITTNKIDDLINKAVEEEIDSRFTDNEGYAGYWFDELGEETIFPLGADKLMILDTSAHIETMSFGKEAKDASEFSIDDFDGSEKTVLNFYDKQVNRYLSKLRKGNWELMTDDNGNEWYETKIMPEDKAAVEAFQTKDNLDRPKIYTGKEVADIVNELEKAKADLSQEELAEYGEDFELSDYLKDIIKDQDFTLRPVKIMNLIQADKDLAEYISRNEQRYPEGADGLENPIVVGNWKDGSFGVLDGYNRILTQFNNGQQFIDAYVSNDVFQLVEEDRQTIESFVDYVRLRQPENIELEKDARLFAEGVGLNPDLSNARLANRFDELLSAMPKFQAMEPSQRADLEYRRDQAQKEAEAKDFEEADRIIQAREADMEFGDPEQEAGYQNFKKLVARRKWILDPDTDDAKLKLKLPNVNVDNDLFSATKNEMTNNDLLETFKERYSQEKEIAQLATQKTSQELANIKKLEAQRAVRAEQTGRNMQLRTAMNIAMGKEAPITITKKASVLLKNRLRDMARAAKTGANFGRAEMRDTLTEAFSTKIANVKTMKKAVATYADQLPIGERGKMLKMVANLSTTGQLVKAYARIDAAMEAVDNKTQLEAIKRTASKLKKAMKTGRGIAVDYQKKIAEVLNEYNLSKPTQKTIDKLKGLSEFIKANPDITIQDHLIKRLENLNKKNLTEFKNEDVVDLNDLLGRLWALGELKYRLQRKGNERAINEAVDRVLSTTVGTTRSLADLSFYHAPRVADTLDGYREYKGENVKLQRKLSDAVSYSAITTRNIVEDVTEIISEIKDKFSKEDQAIMMFNLMKEQGQYDQAQAILGAYSGEFNWKTENDVLPTQEIANVMDILRGVFNKNIDHLAAVYEEIENKPFIKVQNYFPIKYDRTFDKNIEIDAPTVNQMIQFNTKQVQKGFTMARMKHVKKVPRIDALNVFAEAIAEQQYYMRVQPAINEIAAIVGDHRYQQVVGEAGSRWWDKYLKSVAMKGKAFNNGIYDNILRKFKLNVSNAMLGYKVTSALIQPTAIIDAYSYVYLNHGALAANRLLINLAGTLLIPSYSKGIVKHSVGLQLRTAGELTLREMEEKPYGTRIGKAWRKGGMWALRRMDLITASATHQAMYKHFRSKGMEEGDARREADFVMNLTQSSSEVADLPLVLQTGELAKTFLTFQTFVLNRWGIIAHDIGRSAIIHGNIPKKMKGLIALFILSLAGGLEDLLRKSINQKITGKEYKEKFTFMQKALLTTPASIPVVGNIITSVIEFNKGFSIPIASLFENLIKGGQGLINPSGETKSEKEESRKKGALKAAEAILSIKGFSGAGQISDIIERILIPPDDRPNVVGTSAPSSIRPSLPAAPVRPSRPSMPRPR